MIENDRKWYKNDRSRYKKTKMSERKVMSERKNTWIIRKRHGIAWNRMKTPPKENPMIRPSFIS
jgi:hypothetical protein